MTYAIGDIHGCLATLKKLVSSLELLASDKLIFIGDYVDRGPNSRGVIDFLIAISTKYESQFIRGNHEQMFLDYISGTPGSTIWAYNGMETTIRSYGSVRIVPDYHVDFLMETVTHYQMGKYLFVHAGVRPGVALKKQQDSDLMWIREPFLSTPVPMKGRKVVYGHTPVFGGPLDTKGKLGIDTGCVYGGHLTAYRVEDGFHISQAYSD